MCNAEEVVLQKILQWLNCCHPLGLGSCYGRITLPISQARKPLQEGEDPGNPQSDGGGWRPPSGEAGSPR